MRKSLLAAILAGTTAIAATPAAAEQAAPFSGVRVGAGLQLALGPNSYVKTEYRFSDYEQGIERHQIVAGFGFRF